MPSALVARLTAALCIAAACAPTAALGASDETLTAKEKLNSKAADEQRVNDCKVPPAQRTRSDRPAECADAKLTVDSVIGIIRDTASSDRPKLAGHDLSGLDLSNVDFRRADLSGANLFGAKLVGANLAGTDLSGATLDAAWLMRANFAGANLTRASLFGPVVYPTLQVAPADAPNFARANLSGARIIARLSRVDMRESNLAGARMGVDMRNQPMGQMRMDLSGADLSGADLSAADLDRAVITFAKLAGANLGKARLSHADLSGSDLTGADLTGADMTEADLYGTVMKDVRGLDQATGFEQARNREKIIR
jgi:uncharacterized protein YjbI with pentapeptide repeats